jgi:hypothetical protein
MNIQAQFAYQASFPLMRISKFLYVQNNPTSILNFQFEEKADSTNFHDMNILSASSFPHPNLLYYAVFS